MTTAASLTTIGPDTTLNADRDNLAKACRDVDRAADKIILDAEAHIDAAYGGTAPPFLQATISTATTLRNLVADAIRKTSAGK